MLGRSRYLSDKQTPRRRRRRLGIAVAGIIPTANQLTKIGKMHSAGCRLCRIMRESRREARGQSTDGLAAETYCHINSAGCKGMATTVVTAHHFIKKRTRDAQKSKSKLNFVALDKESNMSTIWQRDEFLQICSEKVLAARLREGTGIRVLRTLANPLIVARASPAFYKMTAFMFECKRWTAAIFWCLRFPTLALSRLRVLGSPQGLHIGF